MLKRFLLLISISFLVSTAHAQLDTLKYYMKNSGEMVLEKSQADYYAMILPADSTTGYIWARVNEYYMNRAPKLVSTTLAKSLPITLDGPCVTYFPNGNRMSNLTYKKGFPVGMAVNYYPNGKIYAYTQYEYSKLKLIECRDSSGMVLAGDGNGKWLKYNSDFSAITGEGTVKDSLEDGEWHGKLSDTVTYTFIYKRGEIISGTSYDGAGKAYPFTMAQTIASFHGGHNGFVEDIRHHTSVPQSDIDNKTQGTVTIDFIIEKDGTLSNIKIKSGPNPSLCDAVDRAITQCPSWTPASYYGMPKATHYNFNLYFSNASY